MNPLVTTDYLEVNTGLNDPSTSSTSSSFQDLDLHIYEVDDDHEEYRILSRDEEYSSSPEERFNDFFSKLNIDDSRKNNSLLLQQIELLFHDDTSGIEWFEELERLTTSLSDEDMPPFFPANYNVLSLFFKIGKLLNDPKEVLYADKAQIDQRILLLSRCLTILKKLDLVKDFIDHCELGFLTEYLPPFFFKRFAVKHNSQSAAIPGWQVIMEIGKYLLTSEKQLFQPLLNSNNPYIKIKRNNSDLRLSLIFARQIESQQKFNIFVTRGYLGSGGTKKVKEICCLSFPYQSMAKLTPKNKPKNGTPQKINDWYSLSWDMISEYHMVQKLITLKIPHILPMKMMALQNEKTVILTELCKGRDLYFQYKAEFKGNPNTRFIALMTLMRDALETLYFMHQNQICHLDLKMDNILIQQEETGLYAKLGDFGSARKTGEKTDNLTTYPSPEMVRLIDLGMESAIAASPAIDMWNVGLILFSLRTNKDLLKYNVDWRLTRTKDARKFWYESVRQLKADFSKIKKRFSSLDTTIELLLSDDPLLRPNAFKVIQEIDFILNQRFIE